MHVVIDAHFAVKKIDGITRYLNHLLFQLPPLDRSILFTILTLPQEKCGLTPEIFYNENVKRLNVSFSGPTPRQHLVMRRLLKYANADIYHHPQYNLPLGLTIPSIVTIHDLKYIFHPEFFRKKNWLKSYYIKKSLLYTLKSADKIITVSRNTLEDLKRFTSFDESKTSVIYHGVEKAPDIPENQIIEVLKKHKIPSDYFLFVGSRRPHKNIHGLVRALAILRHKFGHNINLVVVGKKYLDYYEPEFLADELGVSQFIRFLDFIPDHELPALYKSAKAVVLASYYEGFGLPLVESMSYGTPVVGSNVSSIPEIIDDAGLLVDPKDTEDIANKINLILTDSQLAEDLRSKGLLRSKKFDWALVAELTLEVYRDAFKCK